MIDARLGFTLSPTLTTPPAAPLAVRGATLAGTDQTDSLVGSNEADQIDGRGGNDYIYPAGGNDTVQGGDGLDTAGYSADYAELDITFSALTGRYTVNDTVAGRHGTDMLSGVERLYFYDSLDPNVAYTALLMAKTPGLKVRGGEGNDELQGGSGGDSLDGGPGDDRLQGGAGNDLLYDLNGSNTAVFSGRFSDYTVSYFGKAGLFVVTDRKAGRDGTDTLFGINTLQFSDGTRDIWGTLYQGGSPDDDVLTGTSNDNSIGAGPGNDTIDGGRGTDAARFTGYYAEYVVSVDPVSGRTIVTDRVSGRDGVDTLSGVEILEFTDTRMPVGTSAGGEVRLGTDLDDILTGGDGDDSLYGGKGNNTLTGLGGNDAIFGTSYGQTATAVYRGNLADYVITYDSDTMSYRVADQVAGRDGSDTLLATYRLQFADILIDIVTSPGGATEVGGDQADNLAGGSGNDHVEGGNGNDKLNGNAGRDVLLGGGGNDTLDGGADDDWLIGGPGDDKLQGRGGVDTALFSGVRADYLIQFDSRSNSYRINDNLPGRDGVDTVGTVEYLQFADGLWLAQGATLTAAHPGVDLVGISIELPPVGA